MYSENWVTTVHVNLHDLLARCKMPRYLDAHVHCVGGVEQVHGSSTVTEHWRQRQPLKNAATAIVFTELVRDATTDNTSRHGTRVDVQTRIGIHPHCRLQKSRTLRVVITVSPYHLANMGPQLLRVRVRFTQGICRVCKKKKSFFYCNSQRCVGMTSRSGKRNRLTEGALWRHDSFAVSTRPGR